MPRGPCFVLLTPRRCRVKVQGRENARGRKANIWEKIVLGSLALVLQTLFLACYGALSSGRVPLNSAEKLQRVCWADRERTDTKFISEVEIAELSLQIKYWSWNSDLRSLPFQ